MITDPIRILSKILSNDLNSKSPLRLSILLGAGASISSGGETFSQLKKRLLVQLNELSDVESSEGVEEFFDNLFKYPGLIWSSVWSTAPLSN